MENKNREESREHHHHHHHHHKHDKSSGLFVTSRMHLSEELEMQVKRIVTSLLLVVLIAAALFAVRRWENRRDFFNEGSPAKGAYSAAGASAAADSTPEDEYRVRLGLHTYLFMGVDKAGTAELVVDDGGQADAILVLVVDDINETWQTLPLNRDTITSVPVLGVTGQVTDRRNEQLALAHAYGDGGNRSCLNVAGVVSEILEGQKINGYAALNMGGIGLVNDALGGVTVTVESDFSGIDDTLVMGETITLNGEQAENFLRGRKSVDDGTNQSRMERHRQYLHGLREKLDELDKEDAIRIFEEANDYIVSNLSANDFANLLNTLKNYTELPAVTIEGESKIEYDLAAFYMNEESRMNAVRELFYEKK